MKAKTLLLVVIGLLGLAACDQAATSKSGREDASSRDAQVDTQRDAASDVAPDASSEGEDTGIPPDADSDPFARPDRSTYICDESQSRIEYPPIKEVFELPETRFNPEPPTVGYLRRVATQGGGYAATFLLPGVSHPEKTDNGLSFFAGSNDNVKLHVGLWSSRIDLDAPEMEHLGVSGTVLVDYKPVEAHFELWEDDRSAVLDETTDTGARFPIESRGALVDITIPAEAFDEERMYELAVFFKIARPGKGYVGEVRRMQVFHGGYSRPSHPCFPVEAWKERTEEEQTVKDVLNKLSRVYLYIDGETDESIRSLHQVSPGETVHIKYFLTSSSLRNHQPAVLQPLLNGRPIGDPIYVEHEGHSGYNGGTALRDNFELTLPEEPGIYELMIGGWEDAHLLHEDHHGNRYEDIWGVMPRTTSNSVWFEVKASQ